MRINGCLQDADEDERFCPAAGIRTAKVASKFGFRLVASTYPLAGPDGGPVDRAQRYNSDNAAYKAVFGIYKTKELAMEDAKQFRAEILRSAPRVLGVEQGQNAGPVGTKLTVIA